MFQLFERPGPLMPPLIYGELRATTPVARVPLPHLSNAWIATSYDAVAAVLSDPRFGVSPPGTPDVQGDAHARRRRLVMRALTPRRLETIRPRIVELADGYATEFARSAPSADLVSAFAAPLAINVLCELIGVPEEERQALRSWAETALLIGDSPNEARMRQALQALREQATRLVEVKRKRLGNDLLSDLITVSDTDDGRLSDDELTSLVMVLVEGGYLSPRNAISVAVMQALADGRMSDRSPDIDEVTRLLAGQTGEALPRWVLQDVELEGRQLRTGEMVLARIEAANRDPARFPEPDRYVPGRGAQHLTFGRGPHHCIGAALARFELTAALSALARETPGLRLAVEQAEVPWSYGFSDSGPAALPLTW